MKQTIHTILDQFRGEAASNRDLGDRFERLICRYLELDPIYVERFSPSPTVESSSWSAASAKRSLSADLVDCMVALPG